MSLGDPGIREAILALSSLAGIYLVILVLRLLALNKRRRLADEPAIEHSTEKAPPQTASPPPVAPPTHTPQARAAPPPVSPTPPPQPTAKHSVVRIYVKNVSVEVPNMARLPKYAVRPDITVDLQINAQPAWENHLECSLGISLHARLNGVTIFLMEIVQCGLFLMHDTDPQLLHSFVRETAQSVLFPYARKHLANLAVDAGFQPVILDPIDFGLLLKNANVSFPRNSEPPACRE